MSPVLFIVLPKCLYLLVTPTSKNEQARGLGHLSAFELIKTTLFRVKRVPASVVKAIIDCLKWMKVIWHGATEWRLCVDASVMYQISSVIIQQRIIANMLCVLILETHSSWGQETETEWQGETERGTGVSLTRQYSTFIEHSVRCCHISSHLVLITILWNEHIIISTLEVRKLRVREAKWLS